MGNKTSSKRNPPVPGTSQKSTHNVNKSSGSSYSGTTSKKVPK